VHLCQSTIVSAYLVVAARGGQDTERPVAATVGKHLSEHAKRAAKLEGRYSQLNGDTRQRSYRKTITWWADTFIGLPQRDCV